MDARLGGGGWSQVVVGAEATLEVQRVEVGRPQERPRCGRPAGQRVGPPTTGRERLRPGVKPQLEKWCWVDPGGGGTIQLAALQASL